jgi:hypothetical protein
MRNIAQRVKRIEALENATDEWAGKTVVIYRGSCSQAEIAALKNRGANVVELDPEDANL